MTQSKKGDYDSAPESEAPLFSTRPSSGYRPPAVPRRSTGKEALDAKVIELLEAAQVADNEHDYHNLIVTVLKLAQHNPERGDLRLFSKAFDELRYAHKIFKPYAGRRKITVFGSARTWEIAPEYQAAKDFSALMADAGYMVITGAGDGIMGAAQAGGGRENGFGLNIDLPFEQSANETIKGDKKLISFRYFFTRKLMFLKESHAVALFPGGFGTMDEGFETLTLMQTGKSQIVPVVFVDAPGGNYWATWLRYLKEHLLRDGLISDTDFNLFKLTDDIQVARNEILRFYRNFHSYRFVKGRLVIRLRRPVPQEDLAGLHRDFTDIILPDGGIESTSALPEEADEPDLIKLPRLVLDFDRHTFGRLRQLIDRCNAY